MSRTNPSYLIAARDQGAFSKGDYFLGLSTEHTSPRYVWRLKNE